MDAKSNGSSRWPIIVTRAVPLKLVQKTTRSYIQYKYVPYTVQPFAGLVFWSAMFTRTRGVPSVPWKDFYNSRWNGSATWTRDAMGAHMADAHFRFI